MPDEPRGEADQKRFGDRVTALKLIPEPGSDDPGENAHRYNRRCPHSEDLSERVLPYGFIPINRRDLIERLSRRLRRGRLLLRRRLPLRLLTLAVGRIHGVPSLAV